jgi:hypothetical protein
MANGHSDFRVPARGVTLPRMLRRVVTSLRTAIFVLGIALVIWIPASFYCHAWCMLRFSREHSVTFISEKGAVLGARNSVWFYDDPARAWAGISRADSSIYLAMNAFWPVAPYWTPAVSIPLWLLAAICLAWPVTSLLLARRRRKGRGFGVEIRDQKSEVSQRVISDL